MHRATHRLLARLLGVALLLLVTGLAHRAEAFPWMIRHGYTQCNTCHADPSGGGLLTRYGRGMEEVLLRMHYDGKPSEDEDPGTLGNFMFGAFQLPDALLLQADGRYAELGVFPTAPNAPSGRLPILMQADMAGQVKVGRFRANASLGFAHDGAFFAKLTTDPRDNLIARSLWLGVDLGSDEQFLLRAGRFDVPFGIRTIEHNLFTRFETNTNINDQQQTGVALSYTGDKLRGEVMAAFGNYSIPDDALRERGGAALVEWAPLEKLAVGASAQLMHSERNPTLQTAVWRHNYGPFVRYSPWKPLVLMAEGDLIFESQPMAKDHVGATSYVQADLEPFQGIHVMLTGELYNRNFVDDTTSVSAWSTVWWFLAPHMDLRLDAIYTDDFRGGVQAGIESWSLLGQLHLLL